MRHSNGDRGRRRAARRVWAAACALAGLSLSGASSAATVYDEAVGGDLTADEATAPNVGALAPGENSVFGTMNDFGDAFRVELGPGLEITAATVEVAAFTGMATSGRVRLKTGDLGQIFGSVEFTADGSYPLPGTPLPSDTYLFKVFLIGEFVPTYDWEVRLTVPEPAGAAFAALAALGLLARRPAGRPS